MKTTKVWTAYLISRFLVGALDVITDFLHTVHLAEEGHPWWSLATGVWLLLSVLVSVAVVLVGRLRTGDGMHPAKYLLLTALVHADTVEAFVEAGPELVVQLVILWTGVHTHDFEVSTIL